MRMSVNGNKPRGRLPVMAGAALALAGCTESAPFYTPIYTAPAPGGWSYRNGGPYTPQRSYSQPLPGFLPPPVNTPPPSYSFRVPAPLPVNDPQPLRPVAPDPSSSLRFLPSVTFLSPPADATDCTGWWRICHLY